MKTLLIGSSSTRDSSRELLLRYGVSLVERAELGGDVSGCDLVCVLLDHPDQFASEDVRRLLGGLQGCRLVCVRGAWCASMLRSRGDWPVAVVVDAAEYEHRVNRELAVLRGEAQAMPMTAGLEEVAAWNHGTVGASVGGGRGVSVESGDAPYRETVAEQLSEAGFCVTSGAGTAAELRVVDVDSTGDGDMSCQTGAQRTVLVAADLDCVTATGPAIVVSKFEPVGRWLRRLFAGMLIFGGMLEGCQKPPAPVAPVVETKPAWSEQVKGVRAGLSNKISVGAVSAQEWKDLAADCDSLEVLEVDQPTLAPADFEVLLSLSKLRRLKLGSGVDDAAAEVLGRLSKVTQLLVNSDSLTNRGVAALCRLPLVQLRLRAPEATDDAAAEIAKLGLLRFLHLIDVPLTDAALPSLGQIKNLESLYLDGAKCTDAGLAGLLKERPDIHFHRDQTHLADDPRNDGH